MTRIACHSRFVEHGGKRRSKLDVRCRAESDLHSVLGLGPSSRGSADSGLALASMLDMNLDDRERLLELAHDAAQAWVDAMGVTEKVILQNGEELWLEVLVRLDGVRDVIPCAFRPESDATCEEGPALGPDGEPRMLLSCWRLYEHGVLDCGVGFAVYVERHFRDEAGQRRQLSMPW